MELASVELVSAFADHLLSAHQSAPGAVRSHWLAPPPARRQGEDDEYCAPVEWMSSGFRVWASQ